jgi:lipopolysaccharide/colanic/teichoic acid biosynthesis glycosyltransferase
VLTHGVSLLAAAAGLVVLLPLLAPIAVAIKLDSRGPVFFRQDRLGVAGRPFPLLKFRTMHQAGKRRSEWVRDNGHRITRVGRWLRRFRLDELPQLLNVLRGEMNLVGPRPHPVSNGRLFMECIPHYRLRSVVRPGITGWAQVKYGYANGLDEETEKMRYDLFYIKHRSLLLDLRILFATLGLLLSDNRSHEGARHRPGPVVWPRRWRPTLPGASRP